MSLLTDLETLPLPEVCSANQACSTFFLTCRGGLGVLFPIGGSALAQGRVHVGSVDLGGARCSELCLLVIGEPGQLVSWFLGGRGRVCGSVCWFLIGGRG